MALADEAIYDEVAYSLWHDDDVKILFGNNDGVMSIVDGQYPHLWNEIQTQMGQTIKVNSKRTYTVVISIPAGGRIRVYGYWNDRGY